MKASIPLAETLVCVGFRDPTSLFDPRDSTSGLVAETAGSGSAA